MVFKLAFIGFGVVGQGLLEDLIKKREWLKQTYNFEWKIVAISDIIKGSIYDPDGLDPEKCLDLVRKNGDIKGYDAPYKDWDSFKTIRETDSDIIVEVSYTDIKTGEPGLSHVKTAIEAKKHVIMTNKGPMVVASKELLNLAAKTGVQIRYEGTVMSGTPVLMTGLRSLRAAGIKSFKGILNGTTNYILTEMEKGSDYQTALKQAQKLGYAEAKPEGDVEGWDALGKVVILANTLMGGDLKVDDVFREGITKITPEDIEAAKKESTRWKLIGEAKITDSGKIQASVNPMKIPLSYPLASINGVTNAITFETELLGEVTIVGPGAGRKETGFALLSDLIDIHLTINK